MPERKYCGLCGHSLKPTGLTAQPPRAKHIIGRRVRSTSSAAVCEAHHRPYVSSVSAGVRCLSNPVYYN
jgi:hypothetical protein